MTSVCFKSAALASIISIAVVVAGVRTARGDYTTTINPNTTWGVWEGWGASLCWWANVFGYRDDMADLLFTRNWTYFPEAICALNSTTAASPQ